MSSVVKSAIVMGLVAVGAAQVLAQKRAQTQPAHADAQARPAATRRADAARPDAARPDVSKPGRKPALAAGAGMALLEAGRHGHYVARVETPGGSVQMLVDTGASFVALTDADARALGVYARQDAQKVTVSTANGQTTATRITMDTVRVGSITVHDVPALLMAPGASETSLLGMSFLRKLSGYEVAQGRLVLRQ